MPIVEILVSTLDSGIRCVPEVLLPPRPDVRYLVSWQHDREDAATPLPAQLVRPDVRIEHLQGRGLSRNRNNAIAHATGDILVLADDDMSLQPEFIDNIQRTYAAHPEADIITFQALNEYDELMRDYAPHPFTYSKRPRGTFFCSWEISFRRTASLPRFDERFGLGADYLACGEEDIFMDEAYRRGLNIRYEPLPIAKTDSHTTGTLFTTSPAVQRSKGAVLCHVHGPVLGFLHALFEVMILPVGSPRWHILLQIVRGMRYYKTSQK